MRKILNLLGYAMMAKYLMIVSYLVGFTIMVTTENIFLFVLTFLISFACLILKIGCEITFMFRTLRDEKKEKK